MLLKLALLSLPVSSRRCPDAPGRFSLEAPAGSSGRPDGGPSPGATAPRDGAIAADPSMMTTAATVSAGETTTISTSETTTAVIADPGETTATGGRDQARYAAAEAR